MAMRENPASGYVIEASKLERFFPERLRPTFHEAIENGAEAFGEFMDNNWPGIGEGLPLFESIYSPADEDTVDGETMQKGGIYVIFEEDELFEKKPTAAMTKLRQFDAEPQHSRWSVWG